MNETTCPECKRTAETPPEAPRDVTCSTCTGPEWLLSQEPFASLARFLEDETARAMGVLVASHEAPTAAIETPTIGKRTAAMLSLEWDVQSSDDGRGE